MKAHQVMTENVITVRPDTPVDEIAHLLVTHRIGGVPVVDDEDRVVGIVSESDLFLKEKGIPFSAVKLPTLFKQWVDPHRLLEIYENAHRHTASDVMTKEVICVDADEEVTRVARIMAQRGLKRLPVLRDGKLVGIISRTDLIRVLAAEGRRRRTAAKTGEK